LPFPELSASWKVVKASVRRHPVSWHALNGFVQKKTARFVFGRTDIAESGLRLAELQRVQQIISTTGGSGPNHFNLLFQSQLFLERVSEFRVQDVQGVVVVLKLSQRKKMIDLAQRMRPKDHPEGVQLVCWRQVVLPNRHVKPFHVGSESPHIAHL
jgi:hypothetical protein